MRRCQDSTLWSLPHPGHHQLLSPTQPLNPPTSFNSAVTASVRAAVIPHLDQAGRSPLTSLSPHLLPCSDSHPSVRVAFNLLLQADIVWAPSPSLTAYSQTGLFSVSRTRQPPSPALPLPSGLCTCCSLCSECSSLAHPPCCLLVIQASSPMPLPQSSSLTTPFHVHPRLPIPPTVSSSILLRHFLYSGNGFTSCRT